MTATRVSPMAALRVMPRPCPRVADAPSSDFATRSSDQSRAVTAPNAGSAHDLAVALARPAGVMMSMKRPGRADITPTRSESIAASSSACVISMMVAPVSRHSRSTSSPISRRVCWSSAPNGSSSRISRGCSTSVRAMQTRWRMPPESCAG